MEALFFLPDNIYPACHLENYWLPFYLSSHSIYPHSMKINEEFPVFNDIIHP